MTHAPFVNPKDPMKGSTPPTGRELTACFGQAAKDFPVEAVLDAAVNIIMNVLRQQHATRDDAARKWDEYMGRSKGLFLDMHYDSFGRRKGVFAYDQHIQMPLFRSPLRK